MRDPERLLAPLPRLAALPDRPPLPPAASLLPPLPLSAGVFAMSLFQPGRSIEEELRRRQVGPACYVSVRQPLRK